VVLGRSLVYYEDTMALLSDPVAIILNLLSEFGAVENLHVMWRRA